MKNDRKAVGCWWILLVSALLGAALFSLVSAASYSSQKKWVDSLASDGNFESFTANIYSVIRIISLPLAILSIGVLIVILLFRTQSMDRIGQLLSWLKGFFTHRWQEMVQILRALVPSKQEIIPLAVLLVITIFGIFFRYAYLWKPMGHDESYTFMAFASRGLRVVITDYHLPNNHVFHTILVNLFYQVLGDSPAVIRLPAFIAGILLIPATYLIAKIFYDWKIGLLAASVIAVLPVLVDYSTTARGYTIIALFALMIVAISAYVKDNQNLVAWFILIGFSGLGLYTNPTMIYPIGMAFTWLILSSWIKDINPGYGKRFYLYLLLTGVGIALYTGFLYLPIIVTSGLQSVVGNEVVEALNLSDFTQSLVPRIRNTWQEWNRSLHSIFSWIALLGLIASFFVPKLPRNRRVPLILAGFLWIAAALLVQRVAPWPRIWLFLLPFFIIWITAGIFGLFNLLIAKLPKSELLKHLIWGILIVILLFAGLVRTYPQCSEKIFSKGEVEQVADFLQDYLQDGDVVVVTSPDTVVLKYYLMRINIDKEFTELTKGKEVARSIVVVNQAIGHTLEYVLDRRSFLDDVQIASAEEIYQSRRFLLYQLLSN